DVRRLAGGHADARQRPGALNFRLPLFAGEHQRLELLLFAVWIYQTHFDFTGRGLSRSRRVLLVCDARERIARRTNGRTPDQKFPQIESSGASHPESNATSV